MKARKPLRLLAAVAAVAIVAGVVAVVASAVLSGSAGGVIKFVITRESTDATLQTSSAFVDLPGAAVPITVTDGGDLLLGRFEAESACYDQSPSTASRWCVVRIILVNRTTGAFITELNPKSGSDAAFDSTDGGRETAASWEAHAIQRTLRVPNGAYLVKVQRAVSPGAVLRLDDWSLTVEVSQ